MTYTFYIVSLFRILDYVYIDKQIHLLYIEQKKNYNNNKSRLILCKKRNCMEILLQPILETFEGLVCPHH